MTVFDTDAHVEECEETFAALRDRPELAGTAPRVIEGERLDEARIGPVSQVIGDDCILYSSDLPHAHRVFDALKVFGERSDVPEKTKSKILANGARFFSL